MEDRIKDKAEQERFNLTTQNQNRSVEDLKIIIKDLGVRGIQPHWLLLDKSTNHFISLILEIRLNDFSNIMFYSIR